MAGELISLREFVEQRLDAVELLERERWNGQHREQAQRDEAIKTALASVMERFGQVNEWRQTYGDRDKTFATVVGLSAAESRITVLERVNERATGAMAEQQRQSERQIRNVGLLVGLGSVVLSVLLGWIVKQIGG